MLADAAIYREFGMRYTRMNKLQESIGASRGIGPQRLKPQRKAGLFGTAKAVP
jgi:hypothetical protein